MSTKSPLIGFMILGDIAGGNIDVLAGLLMDKYDDELLYSFYYEEHNKYPEGDEYLSSEKGREKLNQIKTIYRNAIADSMNKTAEAERMQSLKEALDGFKAMHKPAPEGTVKELAVKYGKSLSEIRTLKREGRLSELTHG